MDNNIWPQHLDDYRSDHITYISCHSVSAAIIQSAEYGNYHQDLGDGFSISLCQFLIYILKNRD